MAGAAAWRRCCVCRWLLLTVRESSWHLSYATYLATCMVDHWLYSGKTLFISWLLTDGVHVQVRAADVNWYALLSSLRWRHVWNDVTYWCCNVGLVGDFVTGRVLVVTWRSANCACVMSNCVKQFTLPIARNRNRRYVIIGRRCIYSFIRQVAEYKTTKYRKNNETT